jgi:hypothetical protein
LQYAPKTENIAEPEKAAEYNWHYQNRELKHLGSISGAVTDPMHPESAIVSIWSGYHPRLIAQDFSCVGRSCAGSS